MSKIEITPLYSEVKPEGFYVYLHRRATDNSVFYVGKGKGSRAWDTWSRNNWWSYVSRKNGVNITILKDGMNEACAFSLERIAISINKSLGYTLTNMSEGGEGNSGCVMPSRRPVCNSDGERFNSVTEAAAFISGKGLYKAKTGDISGAASGKRQTACGLAWWYEGEPEKEFIDRRLSQSITCGKRIASNFNEIFRSTSEAARYLRLNGYPKAKSYNVSRAASGNLKSSYGRTWAFL